MKKIYVLSLLTIFFGNVFASNQSNPVTSRLQTALNVFGFEKIPLKNDLEKVKRSLLVKAEDDDSLYTVEEVRSFYATIKNSIIQNDCFDILVENQKTDSIFDEKTFLEQKKSIMKAYELLGLEDTVNTKWEDIQQAYDSKIRSEDITIKKQEKLKTAMAILEELKDLGYLSYQAETIPFKKSLIFYLKYSQSFAADVISSNEFKIISNEDKIDIIKIMLHDYPCYHLDPLFHRHIFMQGDLYTTIDDHIYATSGSRDLLLTLFKSLDQSANYSNFIEKKEIFDQILRLVMLDDRFIPFGIKTIRSLKDKTILYEKKAFNVNGCPTSYLDILLRFGKGKFLLSALLSPNISNDSTKINQVINNFVKKIESSRKDGSFDFIINTLNAYTALKDELGKLSVMDYMFFDAYQEYLKGNPQDLRNLVFPISKGIYLLAPKKDSEAQAMNLIETSLKKIFKEDHIKYLLFDLVQANYQKEAAYDLLREMRLISNKTEIQNSVN